jgi:ATP-binding cassette, subfamily B, bacterial
LCHHPPQVPRSDRSSDTSNGTPEAAVNAFLGQLDARPSCATPLRPGGCSEKLRQGDKNVLGKSFENGAELSVGEWQKVALARAFLRRSEIILLDEPTSAMDAKAEYELFKKFHELSKGRTAILISHRLSTVKMVDRIFF